MQIDSHHNRVGNNIGLILMSMTALALGGAGILGYLGGQQNSEAMIDANQANIDMTYDLAQNSIQYRVDDALAAGINPIFALGAPTASPSVPIQNTQPGNSLNNLANTFSQAAALSANTPDNQQAKLKQMNFELMKLQLDEARKANEMPPLFIEAFDPNPNSPTYKGKVWVFNPELETEGITSVIGTTYSNGIDAVKGLEKQVTTKLSKGHKNAQVINSKKMEIMRSIYKRYSIPEKIKARAEKFFNWIGE